MDNVSGKVTGAKVKKHQLFCWIVAICWTFLLLASFFWIKQISTEQVMNLVRVQARTAYEKDVLYRFWNSTHGTVYVPVSEETPPNPYLDVAERDIVTPDGVALTLMNPAYMTRQANELSFDRLGIYGHLTSLKPLRPENEPDTWERQALLEFETGVAEVSSVEALDDKLVLRLMRPLLVEEACLPCHAKQKYEVGQIRGGISVSINMVHSLALLESSHTRMAIGHLLLWVTGLAGLLVRAKMLTKRDHERLEAAERLQEINSQLELRVVDRTAELKKSNRLLKEDIRQRIAAEREKDLLAAQLRQAQKMEVIGHLSGGIAHDFNNLLTPILGYAELAQQRPDISPLLKKDIGRIFGAAERAKGLVRQILDFSRQSDQTYQVVSMQQIVSEVLELLQPTVPQNITIDVQVPNEDLMVEADPIQMHQVVMNLCTNAWQAMHDTEGVLRLTLERVKVAPSAGKPFGGVTGDYVCFKVYDSGCGIDKAAQEKIFEPFFTTKKSGTGTGLGLSVVHGIIHSHGGSIDVESCVGKGSCFQVYLPLIDAAVVSSGLTPTPQGKGERILLVDDEADIVEMLIDGLGGLGFKVTGSSSSNAALELFRQQPDNFDLLLCDRNMPELNGQQLATAIRALNPEIPVLFMTGYDEGSGLVDLCTADDTCLLKPMTASSVAEQIIRQLTGS